MALENNCKRCEDDRIRVVQSTLDVNSIINEEITRSSQKDAFYLCNTNEIIRRHEVWKLIMPRVETYYAVKCNASYTVLEVLAALGIGFDCASQEEMRKILSLGVDPGRIIFANPTKKVSHVEYAAETGVTKMTFDSEHELHKIKRIHPGAKLLIRIKYDDSSARFIFGSKYGCDPSTEAIVLLRLACALDLKVIGVSFHIGSSSKNGFVYGEAIAAARQVFDQAATIGLKLELLDIGGGFPGAEISSIKEIGRIVNLALQKKFPDISIKIAAEPGRYYVNDAFTLASSIHTIKNVIQLDTVTQEKMQIRMYYADLSVFGGLIPILFQEHYTIKALNPDLRAKVLPSIVWGQTMHPHDKISEGVVMLPEMKEGDWVILEEAGAYSVAVSSKFNGFSTPEIRSVVDEDGWMLLTEKVPYPLRRVRFFE